MHGSWAESAVFRIHLVPMKNVYDVQFLNKSLKSFVIFHQLFQPAAEETLLQLFNNPDKTYKNSFIIG